MNKKGFVLAEAIIVSVFVLGMFSYLAINILPLISKYEKALNYDNLTEVYLVNDINDEILLRGMNVPTGDYKYSYDEEQNEVICKKDNSEYNRSICNADLNKIIYKYIGANEILILDQELSDKNNLSRAMREYYNYYKNKNGISEEKIMLVKFQNGKFASMKMEV